jgi:hypothetical protein
MKFLMFIKHADVDPATVTHPQSLYDAMGQFVQESFANGTLKDTGGLVRPEKSTYIRSKGGKLTVKDGPFSEAKEVVGGYAIVEAKSREEAMELANQFMELHRIHVPEFECECEVRQVEEG